MPFEQSAAYRSTAYEFAPGIRLLTASAEDLIVMKAFAFRPRNWADVEGILNRQHGQIDLAYVEMHLGPLLELNEGPEILQRLARIREQV